MFYCLILNPFKNPFRTIYMEFKSVGIFAKSFFVSKIWNFIILFSFRFVLTVHKHIIFNVHMSFLYHLESLFSSIRIRLNFFHIIYRSGNKLKISFGFLTVRASFLTFFAKKLTRIHKH